LILGFFGHLDPKGDFAGSGHGQLIFSFIQRVGFVAIHLIAVQRSGVAHVLTRPYSPNAILQAKEDVLARNRVDILEEMLGKVTFSPQDGAIPTRERFATHDKLKSGRALLGCLRSRIFFVWGRILNLRLSRGSKSRKIGIAFTTKKLVVGVLMPAGMADLAHDWETIGF
jgi:hypothetical protein